MDIKNFLDKVCGEIKYRPVRKGISEELKSHIQEIKEEYTNKGIPENEAEEKAVSQMGVPEEIGRKLNKIHKPKLDWKLLLLMVILMGFGVFVAILKQQNKKINDVNTANEKITDVINTNKVEKKSVAKKNGALFSILIFILFSLYGCAGIQYEPVAPNIVILQYKLETVVYDYDNKSNLFTFTHENMNNLVYNIDVMKDIINKWRK